MEGGPSGSSHPQKREAAAEAGSSEPKRPRSDPYGKIAETLIDKGMGLHKGLLGADPDPNETSDKERAGQISRLQEKLSQVVFMGDDDQGEAGGGRRAGVQMLGLGRRESMSSFSGCESSSHSRRRIPGGTR